MSDPQDIAEALDTDKVGDVDFPPEEPLGVDEDEVTPRGERTDESFAERDARYESETVAADEPVIQPYQGPDQDLEDTEKDAVAEAEIDARDPDADRAPAQAEEAALHLEDG